MDPPDFPSGKSPRRELQLQGPRPTPLKVRKDSHKIKKPPVVPQSQPPPQHRPPVIIYAVSPKVIHTNPSEFMKLVQRLTGPSSGPLGPPSGPLGPSSSSSSFLDHNNGAISPAARFASIEKIKSPDGKKILENRDMGIVQDTDVDIDIDIDTEIERTVGSFPGILSPGPSSLQPIPANFFSPPSSDPNSLSFFHDLSPVLQGNKSYLDSSFMNSPSNFLSPSTPSLDLFNNFFDF